MLGMLVENDLTPVRAVDVPDLIAQLALEPLGAQALLAELVLEAEHVLDAGKVEPELGGQPLDHAQPLQVGLGVEARAAGRPLRPHEPLRLVHAQRLLVHADELCGDGDHVARAVRHQRLTFLSSSRSSRSFFDTFCGTVRRTRASRSPFPPPFSLGAPRPLTLSSFPGCEPAGTLSEIGPSGVGTSTEAPRAASAYDTGTSTTRLSPRRS